MWGGMLDPVESLGSLDFAERNGKLAALEIVD